ncbi:hypothetical protein HMPREF0986_04515 [Escherichia coli 4_1_47FAA]|nr:hypothetical protein HMPREF0986_04515 [Escherichia coli 4_1_47FAA]
MNGAIMRDTYILIGKMSFLLFFYLLFRKFRKYR